MSDSIWALALATGGLRGVFQYAILTGSSARCQMRRGICPPGYEAAQQAPVAGSMAISSIISYAASKSFCCSLSNTASRRSVCRCPESDAAGRIA